MEKRVNGPTLGIYPFILLSTHKSCPCLPSSLQIHRDMAFRQLVSQALRGVGRQQFPAAAQSLARGVARPMPVMFTRSFGAQVSLMDTLVLFM